MSVVTMDEILTKLDIVLEEVIGCEVDFTGTTAASEIVSAPSASSRDHIVLTSTEVVKVDHRLAVRVLSESSPYRVAFTRAFKQALINLLALEQDSVTIVSIASVDALSCNVTRPGVANLVQEALVAGRVNPAWATAALASETTSRVAAWITGHDGGRTIAVPEPFGSQMLALRFSVLVPSKDTTHMVSKIEALGTASAQSFMNLHFNHTFKRGFLDKLNNVLVRSDALLQQLEPKIQPGFEETMGTLKRLNDVLEQTNRVVKSLEDNSGPFRDDLKSTLDRLNDLLERSSRLLCRAEDSFDAVWAQKADLFFQEVYSIVKYVKFALLGVGMCGFSIAYGIFRILIPVPMWTIPEVSTRERRELE